MATLPTQMTNKLVKYTQWYCLKVSVSGAPESGVLLIAAVPCLTPTCVQILFQILFTIYFTIKVLTNTVVLNITFLSIDLFFFISYEILFQFRSGYSHKCSIGLKSDLWLGEIMFCNNFSNFFFCLNSLYIILSYVL